MKETGAYRASYERSLSDPEGFWRDAAAGIAWIEPPTRVLDAVTDATKVPAQCPYKRALWRSELRT
jgi:hypothetical protein